MENSHRSSRETKNVKLSRSKTIAFDRGITENSTSEMSPSGRVYQPHRRGRDMFEEGEYVETVAVTSVQSGSKTMSSALKRRSGMQSMTVRLPKNPFVDDDYADMTGHQNSPVKMEMLRRTLKPTQKARSHSESSRPVETEFRGSEADSLDRISPLRDTVSPARSKSTAASRTSSVRSNLASSAEDDVDARRIGKDKELPRSSNSFSGSTMSNGELKKSPIPTVAEETPAVVAIVVEETAPPVNSYQTFSKGVRLGEKQQQSHTRNLFFKTSKCKTTVVILAIIFFIMLIVAIGILGYIVGEKNKEIERLHNYINFQHNSMSTTSVVDSSTPSRNINNFTSTAISTASGTDSARPITSSTSTTVVMMKSSEATSSSLARITTVEGSATTEVDERSTNSSS